MNATELKEYRDYESEVFVDDIESLTHEEWLEMRKFGIGGSDCATVFGASPWKTKKDLFWDKTGQKDAVQEEENWVAKEVGHRLEELVLQIFSKKTGLKPYTIRHMFRHPKYPWMLADVDAFVKVNDKIYIVEVKTCSVNALDKWGDKNSNVVPYHYEMQGRHYMAVTNTDGVIFVCLAGNTEDGFRMRTIERDYDIEKEIIEMEDDFWNNHVVPGIEPEYVESADMVLASLKKHFGENNGKTIAIPSEYQESMKAYLSLKAQKAELDKQVKQITAAMNEASIPFKEFLQGNGGEMELDGKKYGVVYTPRTTYSIKAEQLADLKLKHPDIYDEYVHPSVSVSCTVKEIKEKKSKKSA